MITVKDVTGETQAQAQADLTSQGFAHVRRRSSTVERPGERRQGDQPGSGGRVAAHEGHDDRAHGRSGDADHHRRPPTDHLTADGRVVSRDVTARPTGTHAHGRHDLPWRATRDRWAVLVAEVMLQQTQVARVEQMWQPFLARFPDPQTAAAAGPGALIAAWDRLGYPRRARRLVGERASYVTRARLARRPHRAARCRSLHRRRGRGRGRRRRHGRARHQHPPGRRARRRAPARASARPTTRAGGSASRCRAATGCSR